MQPLQSCILVDHKSNSFPHIVPRANRPKPNAIASWALVEGKPETRALFYAILSTREIYMTRCVYTVYLALIYGSRSCAARVGRVLIN